MGAFRGSDRNRRQAQRTVFGGWGRRGGRRLEPVHLFHEHKDHERDDDEIEHGLEKYTVVDGGSSGRLGRSERGLRRPREIEKQAGKIDFAQDQPERWHQDVAYQRCDDLAKGSSDDDPDGHIENIALHRELFELLQHTSSFGKMVKGGLALPRRIDRIPERDEIEIVGADGSGGGLTVVARGDLEAADEAL